MREWTIDTCILYKSMDMDFAAIEFLLNVMKKGCIVLDHEKKINVQYEKCFKKARGVGVGKFILDWWNTVSSRGQVRYVSSDLVSSHRRMLEKLKFHDDDIPFVAVCNNSSDKLLVSDDSDYSPIVIACLKEKMSIKFFLISDAVNFQDEINS